MNKKNKTKNGKKKLSLEEIVIDERITEIDESLLDKVSGGMLHTVDNGNNVRDCNYTPVR